MRGRGGRQNQTGNLVAREHKRRVSQLLPPRCCGNSTLIVVKLAPPPQPLFSTSQWHITWLYDTDNTATPISILLLHLPRQIAGRFTGRRSSTAIPSFELFSSSSTSIVYLKGVQLACEFRHILSAHSYRTFHTFVKV